MAPSRRKGANKASSAAAARRKWKVGDLVLAKVKGFPAWPATVSEPEKWGYPVDQKKVVVHFFGCEQICISMLLFPKDVFWSKTVLDEVPIFNKLAARYNGAILKYSAFCNPVDIEEFTEEKKVSLLGKRHGKGADFIRAANEIIDCFEKLKKQDLVSRAIDPEETNISDENSSQESLIPFMKDESPGVAVDPLCAGMTNGLNSLTEAAVAAAKEDAFRNEEMPFSEAPSNLSGTYLTRKRSDVDRSQNSGSERRKPARRLRSSSRIDATRLRGTALPSVNNNRNSRRLCVSASGDKSLRRGNRIFKSSDDSEGQNVESLAFVADDCIEESDSGVMNVESDTLSIDIGRTVDSVSNPVGAEEPSAEINVGETELSDRLDFQSNNVIKKKRKPNRKRHNNDTIEAAKLNTIASDAGKFRTECASLGFREKLAQTHGKEDGDEHLPLVKRARVRMGRPSAAVEEDLTLVHKEEEMTLVPECHSVRSFEPLSCNVDALPANRESISVKEEPALSSLSHVSPANRLNFWETRKSLVDGEATLPPSKRLHRALEAMSANVAEDCQRASNCSPSANIQSNGYCTSSSLECSGKKTVVESGPGAQEDLSNGDSLLSAFELCIVSNVKRLENGGRIIAVGSDGCKISNIDSRDNPELCTGSSEQAEGADTRSRKMSLFVEAAAETDAIAEDHLKLDSVNVGEQLANLSCLKPGSAVSAADMCNVRCTELKAATKGSDPDFRLTRSHSTLVQDIAGGSPNIDTCNRFKSAGDEDDKAHKTEDCLSVENNQVSDMSKFVEEARPASLTSKIMHSVTPVKILNNGNDRSLFHSTSVSYNHMEDRTISAIQSTSSLTDGPDSVAKASPPTSICNIYALDTSRALGNNSSSCADVQLHLEKAKLACKSSIKGEALSSFETIIKSLTRTKETIARATRIAIECAKFGFATKVVEILVCNLESESSLHKKVDLFFLVDSITQCSRGIKGDGGVYPSAIQALLPRLLLAAAPPGSSSHENHRQCLKVLRVWQERKILPEPIIRHHIRELDTLCGSYPTIGSNRTLRNERAFDDPIREMDGMLVDEYGSNSSIQLPGFCMPPMLRDDGAESDSDGESFEAVTPEHKVDNLEGAKTLVPPALEKHRRILEDVDGELEMEDVAPCCEDEIISTSNVAGIDQRQILHQQSDNSRGQQRKDVLLPPPHSLTSSVFPLPMLNSVSNGPDIKPSSSSQESLANPFVLPRDKATKSDVVHHHVRENKDYEADVPRDMSNSSSACFNDRPTSRFSGRASNNDGPIDAFSKSFHLRPPHPAPSNQFSYVQERVQSRRDIPPPSRPNRFHSRNSDNGNFYRDRDRNKFVQHDDIGEGWRPPYSSISGTCYPNGARMADAPMSYGGPYRDPPLPHNRWNLPSRPMNHRHFNPYRPLSDGPIPVSNRAVLTIGDQDEAS
ncbi:hypothetical protein OROGR_019336 [Orobanche gracilis]